MEASLKTETMLDRTMLSSQAPVPPIAQLLGIRVISVLPGEFHPELEAGPQHFNSMGTLHGGFLRDLADLPMGAAYATTLNRGETFTTLERLVGNSTSSGITLQKERHRNRQEAVCIRKITPL